MRSLLAAIPVLVLAAIAAVFVSNNYHNVQAPAGYAAYVVERPILGSTSFQRVIFGPGSTGLVWRAYGDLVSITPYSYSELFETSSSLIAKDKLPIIGGAHIEIGRASCRERV